MFLKNRNIIFKMKISKVTDYAALKYCIILLSFFVTSTRLFMAFDVVVVIIIWHLLCF